jgi:putative intracellular protease/amidase
MTPGVVLAIFMALPLCAADEPKWISLLSDVNPAEHAVVGRWERRANSIFVPAAEGARLALPANATEEYDLRASFTRRTGVHSVGLVFVANGRQSVFEVDAWGQHLAGFQNVSGKTIQDNNTRRDNITLTNGSRYTITVQVRRNSVTGLLDDKEICRLETDGTELSMHDVWRLPNAEQLGLVTWNGDTEFHSVEIRHLGTIPAKLAKTPRPEMNSSAPAGRKSATPAATRNVLMVIANEDFFYREYADPRRELENAGIRVTVAAGRKSSCRPHPGTGEGADGGVVNPDLALSDVKADQFDAILFSGGWGASSYQFAFPGRYDKASYNGNRSIRAEANRIINEFIEQDKYVCALCNGVSVLAWARVNGKSPLEGKRVCAPVRQAASGIYNGRPAQPPCLWHPEVNGALISPSGSGGQPGNVADDVLVDGKIITGEDDPSAREMGRKIA